MSAFTGKCKPYGANSGSRELKRVWSDITGATVSGVYAFSDTGIITCGSAPTQRIGKQIRVRRLRICGCLKNSDAICTRLRLVVSHALGGNVAAATLLPSWSSGADVNSVDVTVLYDKYAGTNPCGQIAGPFDTVGSTPVNIDLSFGKGLVVTYAGSSSTVTGGAIQCFLCVDSTSGNRPTWDGTAYYEFTDD